MKIALVIVAILAGVYFLAATLRSSGDSKTVTLQPGPGNSVVQMFNRIGDNADLVRQLPAGTTCTKISGPIATDVSGIGMSFHLLHCDGTTGYVNAKWVR